MATLWAWYSEHRFGVLFYSLLASLLVSPVIHPLGLSGGVVEALLAVNLLAAALAIDRGPLRKVALATLTVALVARPGAATFGQDAVAVGSLAAWGVLALFAAANALRFALRGEAVGPEQIHAALGAYLLAGFCFGLLYWVLEQAAPGALSAGGVAAEGGLRVTTTIYFSFVTLASLGYGDILPLSDPARGLAVVEVVSGQLYLAVLVARLVSGWRGKV
ncbi:MAG: potassium channel family protein [Gammaproteobacteria bacterium]